MEFGIGRRIEVVPQQRSQTPAKVTTKTFRESNGDRIVTITQRHATATKPGRIVTTITSGIISGSVQSQTFEQEVPRLSHLESISALDERALYEDIGNEELRKEIMEKITRQLF